MLATLPVSARVPIPPLVVAVASSAMGSIGGTELVPVLCWEGALADGGYLVHVSPVNQAESLLPATLVLPRLCRGQNH